MKLVKKFREPSGRLKFGSGHVSQAMRRQYDREQGIATERVLPEVVYTLPGAKRVANHLKRQKPRNTGTYQQCATLSNKTLRDIGGYNIRGNAWNLTGAKILLNGFEELNKPTIYTDDDLYTRNKQAADNFKQRFDINSLNPDSIYVTNMFYDGSHYVDQALQEGQDYNGTHEAILFNDNNQWKVYHGIGKDILIDNLEDVLGSGGQYGITALLQPLY